MVARALLCLAVAQCVVRGGAGGRLRGGFAQPDWTYYHTTDQVFAYVEQYASEGCPVLRVKRVSDQTDKYKVNSMVVTVVGGGSSTPGVRRAGAMVVFGEHARELISSEICMRLVAMLCAPWASTRATPLPDPLREAHEHALQNLQTFGQELNWLENLLAQVDLRIVPVENPNGRRLVEGPSGKLCHRMNGRRVDINRNFDTHFGVHPPEYLPSEEYEGLAAFSEPETRITRDLAKELKDADGFDAFVSVHAGIREMYLPYDHKPEVTAEPSINEVLAILNTKHCQCNTGSAAKIGGYKAFGTATGYMYEVMKTKYVYTWEVVGDLKANNHDCFRMFNPVTAVEYEKEVSNWAAAVLTLLEEVVSRELPRSSESSGNPQQALGRGGPTPVFDPSAPDKNPGPLSNAGWSG